MILASPPSSNSKERSLQPTFPFAVLRRGHRCGARGMSLTRTEQQELEQTWGRVAGQRPVPGLACTGAEPAPVQECGDSFAVDCIFLWVPGHLSGEKQMAKCKVQMHTIWERWGNLNSLPLLSCTGSLPTRCSMFQCWSHGLLLMGGN